MHSSHFNSVKLHHDSDVDGCMYLVANDDTEIVTTLQDLKAAVAAQPTSQMLTLTGPDATLHDRFKVTAPDYLSVKPGAWNMVSVSVMREDVQAFIVDASAQKLARLAQDLDMTRVPYALAMEKLEAAIAVVKTLAPPA